MTVKASRYLTHIKRLAEPAEPVARLLERARCLGSKLGPILLQLPPTLRADNGRLRDTLDAFPSDVALAVEFRHESWFTDETRAVLTERNAALCLADSPRRTTPVWRTAPWGYLRMHEGRASPHPCYGRQALASWAARLAELWSASETVYCYFNNDPQGCAVRDAAMFAKAVEKEGRDASPVPPSGEVRVG